MHIVKKEVKKMTKRAYFDVGKVRAMIGQKRMKKSEIAELLKIHPTTLTAKLNGKTSVTTEEESLFAFALGCDVKDLYSIKEVENANQDINHPQIP